MKKSKTSIQIVKREREEIEKDLISYLEKRCTKSLLLMLLGLLSLPANLILFVYGGIETVACFNAMILILLSVPSNYIAVILFESWLILKVGYFLVKTRVFITLFLYRLISNSRN